ncbi:MAG TPA: lipoprotein-releasing ABC transporter permease subunit [Rubrivivax sp.]|nr:lipoprotein-releasing ABC transporter permease subunit [Rubrivivax sp.]
MATLPYEWQIGWRFLRGRRRAGRRNGFVSFIAGVAVLGIALGVAALVVVLSVMNGFEHEVRARMLDVIPHVELVAADGRALADPQRTMHEALATPGVVAAAPFVAAQVLIGRGDTLRGALLRGVEPAAAARVTTLAARLDGAGGGPLAALQPLGHGIILGRELARALDARPGDGVALVVPTHASGGEALPHTVAFTVLGIFDAGHYEYDSTLAYVRLEDAAALLGTGGATGIALRLDDPLRAPTLAGVLAQRLGEAFYVRDWTMSNRTWFEAVQLQKRMLALILVLIVAVAAFNLVSTLVMTVSDKRADIAILRTLGASPRSVMGIFFVQGALSGVAGTIGGVALGLLVALNVGTLVPAIERLLGTSLLPASVYFIDHMPSEPRAGDIVPIALASLALAFVATLYPSWRASRVEPAVELRGE